MNEGSAQPRRKPTNLTLDGLEDLALDGPLLAASPLSLLSPNALHAKSSRSPAPAKSESPGALPSFNNRRSRPDPRRQSNAIFAGFAAATSGAGLLDDDEIAVGDEDILISLPVAAKSQVSGTSHSTLWLEPHTEELLEGDLPEPAFAEAALSGGRQEEHSFGATLGGSLEPIPESPTSSQGEAGLGQAEHCSSAALGSSYSSPTRQPGLRPSSRASSHGPSPVKLPSRGATPQATGTSSRDSSPQKSVGGVRDSTVLSEGLSKLCLEAGFDEWDTDDFQLQDGNKVKEMAFLFKMESDAKAASPASSPKFSDAPAASLPTCTASSAGEANSVKEKVGKLQQEAAATKAAAGEGSARKTAAARPAVGTSRPVAKAASNSAGSKAASGAAGAGKSAPVPAAGARPSRLRPPSTSSSYFSHSAKGNRAADASKPQQKTLSTSRATAVPAATFTTRTTAAATAQRPASSLWAPVAPNNASRPATVATASRPTTATSGGIPVRSTVSSRPSTAPSPQRPSSSVAQAIVSPTPAAHPASGGATPVASQRSGIGGITGPVASRAAPGRSRLAQSSTAAASTSTPLRAPAGVSRGRTDDSQAAAGRTAAPAAEQPRRGIFNQRTLTAAASRLKPPSAPSCKTPTPAPQQPPSSGPSGSSLPKLRLGSPAVSPSNANLTPNTARIRFLEQHPELVFGGGSKVGNSPTSQEAEQMVRRKTAEERHLEVWGENL